MYLHVPASRNEVANGKILQTITKANIFHL